MQHLIGLIATQLPFACATLALHGHLLDRSLTFLAAARVEKWPRKSAKI